MKQQNIYNQIPIFLFNQNVQNGAWWDYVWGGAANLRIKTFECPSDPSLYQYQQGVFVYLADSANANQGVLTGYYVPGQNIGLGLTNYMPSAGALGNINDGWQLYCGPFYTNSNTTMVGITDGTSNTLAFGETVGGTNSGSRDFSVCWMGAGAMPGAWDLINPSQWYSFGSFHTAVVQFAYADGSVHMLRKLGPNTPWWTDQYWAFLYALGKSDGGVVNFSAIE